MVEYRIYEENYIVLSNGEVWKIHKNHYRKMNPNKKKNGYWNISINNKATPLHKVITRAFLGDTTLTVDHIDGNKNNNKLSNLEYVTQAENTRRMFDRTGTDRCSKIGKKYFSKKIMWNDIVFESVSDFFRKIGYKSTSGIAESVRKGWKVKGHLISYL